MANKGVKTWVIIIFAVVVIAGIIWYAASMKPGAGPAGQGSSGTSQSSTVGVAQFAPKGQVVAGFPPSLILDPNAAVSGSYTINYSQTMNQYTAEWNSSSSMSDLYAAYEKYLPANGWTIVTNNSKVPGIRAIYSESQSSTVSVYVLKTDAGSQVTVTYTIQ